MNFLQTKINEMKKRKEEGNKGFSLVELIIVIAIMAILVGIVGTQVIPYINKSKESKDLQIINSFSTAAVSSYSENADKISATTGTITIKVYGSNTDSDATKLAEAIKEKTYADKADVFGQAAAGSTAAKPSKMKSKNGKSIAEVKITIDLGSKKVTTQAYSDSACTDGKEVFEAVEATL